MIDLREVGAHPSIDANGNLHVTLGLYLPGITAAKGYKVVVRVIHEDDQFTPEIPPKDFVLDCHDDHEHDLWDTTLNLSQHADPTSSFGQAGTYLYRYQLQRQHEQVVTLWFTDPFARAS